jgi:hypothetical protein
MDTELFLNGYARSLELGAQPGVQAEGPEDAESLRAFRIIAGIFILACFYFGFVMAEFLFEA